MPLAPILLLFVAWRPIQIPVRPTRTTPYIHIGRKLYLRKPHNPSSCLLGLAYKLPISHQWCSTTLLFNLLRNHYCRNKPTDALVLHTILYSYRVIRGRLLLTPLPSITIFFATQNWSSIF